MHFLYFRGGGAFVHLLLTWTRGGGCKMSTLVHSRGGGGRNWSKFGPRSCWMPICIKNEIWSPFFYEKNKKRKCVIVYARDFTKWNSRNNVDHLLQWVTWFKLRRFRFSERVTKIGHYVKTSGIIFLQIWWPSHNILTYSGFSEKATKVWKNITLIWPLMSKHQDFFSICGLLTISWL